MTLIALFTNVWPALVGVAAGGGAYLWMDGWTQARVTETTGH